MYLAGLMADEKQISKETLQDWAEKAGWYMISEYTVAWIAAETPHGFELGLKWIESDKENIASAGWSTLANYAAITADEDLDIKKYSALLDRVEKEVHDAKNRASYAMNGFVIAVGSYIKELTEKAKTTGEKIGKDKSKHERNSLQSSFGCYLYQKIEDKGRVGKKKKMARC